MERSLTATSELARLTGLTALHLQQVATAGFPATFEMPAVLAGLTSLQHLVLRASHDDTRSTWGHWPRRFDFAFLPDSLTYLQFGVGFFRNVLPSQLSTLTRLQALSVEQESFSSGWQHLPHSLTGLFCGIHGTALPEELSVLPNLREIDLRRTKCTTGFEHLPPSLTMIYWSPLQTVPALPANHIRFHVCACIPGEVGGNRKSYFRV